MEWALGLRVEPNQQYRRFDGVLAPPRCNVFDYRTGHFCQVVACHTHAYCVFHRHQLMIASTQALATRGPVSVLPYVKPQCDFPIPWDLEHPMPTPTVPWPYP